MSEFTVKDLLENPAGKYSRQVGARYMIKDGILARLLNLMKEKKDKFTAGYSRSDTNMLWVKIPSATVNLQYDVLIKLIPDGGSSKSLRSCGVQVYCNSPSWVYTYGYVAVKQELIIPEWADALGEAKDEKPEKTNPDMVNGFDSVVTMALLYLTEVIGLKYTTSIQMLLQPVDIPEPDDELYSASYISFKRARLASAPRKVVKKEKVPKDEAPKETPKKKTVGIKRTGKIGQIRTKR